MIRAAKKQATVRNMHENSIQSRSAWPALYQSLSSMRQLAGFIVSVPTRVVSDTAKKCRYQSLVTIRPFPRSMNEDGR